ncbi:class I SAM-dependent methyltransferase [Rhodoferax aquaticus]|uniref:Class I SAM-dependent methyltransferase n=1 Tax=Rhodoferax aquaticus TaxID=2527691 RepID=A0A515EM17_9BURK|nr:class I SAM-dependent methyltransferase [Rhodoferax aquaticus]QDL53696.1 class I SAM-dependent methyltransferase [Rhodoferax aquaticus]
MPASPLVNYNQRETTTLVFPATHLDGLEFIESAQQQGIKVVAATSEWDADVAQRVGDLMTLPYIYDERFPACFLELVSAQNIDQVYCPVSSVYIWLNNFIQSRGVPIALLGESPTQKEVQRHEKLLKKVDLHRTFIDQCSDGACNMRNIEVAAVLRMAADIYGESNEQKIAAMMAIFSSVPKGDVIEIGSLAGKSAAVLALMARRHNIGNILSVDSWQWEAGTQHDSPENVSVSMANAWDLNVVHDIFTVNLFPIGVGVFNYIHNESAQAFEIYRRDLSVYSATFGRTDYTGKIALIHIDANHDYVKVKLDCDLWLQMLAPDGWLILDDYLWAHGDGPYRMGNELLAQRSDTIERAFVCGKALFIKFNSAKN